MAPKPELELPTIVVSQVDVARLIRELNSLEDFFTLAEIRQSGSAMEAPRLTRTLDGLATANKLNLLEKSQRQRLGEQLNELLESAPLMHISFASEPSPRILAEIVKWFRANIHKNALLQVGLQPTIAAGCVLRTPNKVFDLSLRTYLKQQEPYLVQLISGAAHGS